MRLTAPIPSLRMPPKGQSYALFNATTAAVVNTRGGPAIKQCGVLVKHFSAMAMQACPKVSTMDACRIYDVSFHQEIVVEMNEHYNPGDIHLIIKIHLASRLSHLMNIDEHCNPMTIHIDGIVIP